MKIQILNNIVNIQSILNNQNKKQEWTKKPQ